MNGRVTGDPPSWSQHADAQLGRLPSQRTPSVWDAAGRAPQLDGAGMQFPRGQRYEPSEPMNMMHIMNQLVDIQRVAHLPSADLEHFDGSDIQRFPVFIKAFGTTTEDVTPSSSKRLEMLLKHTEGEANELIKDCILMASADEAYAAAMKLLNQPMDTHPCWQSHTRNKHRSGLH